MVLIPEFFKRIRDIVIDTINSHPRGTSTFKGQPELPLENIRMVRDQFRYNRQ